MNIKHGEKWLVNLDQTSGAEIPMPMRIAVILCISIALSSCVTNPPPTVPLEGRITTPLSGEAWEEETICLPGYRTEFIHTNFMKVINQHREHFSNRSDHLSNLLSFSIGDLYYSGEYARLLWQKLQNPIDENASGDDRFIYLNLIEKYPVVKTYGLFIEDDIVIQIFVSALFDHEKRIREKAFSNLGFRIRDKKLLSHAEHIKKALCQYYFRDNAEIFSRLPLSREEKEYLLEMSHPRYPARPYFESWMRARLGDKKAERELISVFESEKDFRKKRYLVNMLGKAGTKACGKTLAEALDSGIEERDFDGGGESIRHSIIEAFHKMHQENPLFFSEFRKVREFKRYDDHVAEVVRKYLKKVYAWAEKTYDIQLKEIESRPILRVYIPRP